MNKRAATSATGTRYTRKRGQEIASITRQKKRGAVNIDQPNDTQLTDMDSSLVSFAGKVGSNRWGGQSWASYFGVGKVTWASRQKATLIHAWWDGAIKRTIIQTEDSEGMRERNMK